MENRGIVEKSFLVAKERFRLYTFRESDREKTEHILSVMCPRWERNENAVVPFPVWGTLPIA